MTDQDCTEMRIRAERWLAPPSGQSPITRDQALNEEHLALDVLDLLAEVKRLRGITAVERIADMLKLGEPVRPDIHALVRHQRDWLQSQLAAMTAARDELAIIAILSNDHLDRNAEAKAARIAELRAIGKEQP